LLQLPHRRPDLQKSCDTSDLSLRSTPLFDRDVACNTTPLGGCVFDALKKSGALSLYNSRPWFSIGYVAAQGRVVWLKGVLDRD
jgi:hypothetical protein